MRDFTVDRYYRGPPEASTRMALIDTDSLKRLASFIARRSRDARIQQVAGSLTFTTVLALVPLLTVAFALFTAFPLFAQFQSSLQSFLADHLMPPQFNNQIFRYLDLFASKAKSLTTVGLFSALRDRCRDDDDDRGRVQPDMARAEIAAARAARARVLVDHHARADPVRRQPVVVLVPDQPLDGALGPQRGVERARMGRSRVPPCR